LATLRTDRAGAQPRFNVHPQFVDAARIEKLRQGQVAALLRHLTVGVSLHASAISIDGQCILFLGERGAGKSTTAAALCSRADVEFIADDTAAIDFRDDAAYASSSETKNWLAVSQSSSTSPSSGMSPKMGLPPRKRCRDSVRIACAIRLVFDADTASPQVVPIKGQSAFEVLSSSTFRFVFDDRAILLRDFSILSKMSSQVPMYELRRSPAIARISQSVDAILELARVSQSG
jgi:ABC-type dipeptide/oligopeptide/nickel transport system ATPase component